MSPYLHTSNFYTKRTGQIAAIKYRKEREILLPLITTELTLKNVAKYPARDRHPDLRTFCVVGQKEYERCVMHIHCTCIHSQASLPFVSMGQAYHSSVARLKSFSDPIKQDKDRMPYTCTETLILLMYQPQSYKLFMHYLAVTLLPSFTVLHAYPKLRIVDLP
jgi:hypothetical protein